MKTIDLLVQELPALGGFPDGAVEAGFLCSNDTLYFVNKDGDCPSEWRISMKYDVEDRWVEVNREQYEAALAAKNEGWIDWGGGKHPPVSTNTVVDVKLEKGYVQSGYPAGEYSWEHVWQGSNIIAYRLHQPQEVAHTKAEQEADMNECIGQAPKTEWNGEGLPPVGCECEYSLNGGVTWWKCKIDYIVGTQGVVMLCDTFEGVQYVQFSSYGNALKFRPIRSEADRKRDESLRVIYEILDAGTSTKQDAADIYGAIAAGKIPGVKLDD